jgi:GT2 family glycosyltransferase
LRAHPEAGLIGPKLLNSDGSLQLSCSRFPHFFTPVLRRTFLGDYFRASRDRFMMTDFDHNSLRAVDWLMGSCLMFRKSQVLADGTVFAPRFDERYFMYFEDIDLARQVWTAGRQVIYDPSATVIHDHVRESAKHPWYIALFSDKITWVHISSWFKYFIKWGIK